MPTNSAPETAQIERKAQQQHQNKENLKRKSDGNQLPKEPKLSSPKSSPNNNPEDNIDASPEQQKKQLKNRRKSVQINPVAMVRHADDADSLQPLPAQNLSSSPHQKSYAVSEAVPKYLQRMSFSLRGKRKSSFGELQSVLHSDILVSDFHSHVDPNLPDPVRLRQIIIYALKRQLETLAQSQKASDKAAKLCHNLLAKKVPVSWFNRPRSDNELLLISKPNPVNAELQGRINGYFMAQERMQSECDKWESLLSSISVMNTFADERMSDDLLSMETKRQQEQFQRELLAFQNMSLFKNNIESIHQIVTKSRRYIKLQQMNVNSQFAQIADACWNDMEDEEDETLIKTTNRRLSFNLRDKTMKILSVLSTAETKTDS